MNWQKINYGIIYSDNDLLSVWHQAIIWISVVYCWLDLQEQLSVHV